MAARPFAPSAHLAPPLLEPPVIEFIDETTVGDLDGVRVAMGNVTTGTYSLPDGTERSGDICVLAFFDDTSVWVGAGSVVDVEGTRWEVIEVINPPRDLGCVRLRRLD